MVVQAHNIQASIKSRLRTPRLLIIEFILEELPELGSAGEMLYLSLIPNYTGKAKNLHHQRIRFDLKNGAAISKHIDSVKALAKKLQKMYAF
jgi:hypothetical protein